MARLKCKSCDGEFSDVLPDGTRYFHACPPLSVPQLKTAISDGTVILPAPTQAALNAATAADALSPVKPGDQTRADQVLGSLVVERPNKRDENVIVDATTKQARAKSDGAGVVTI